MSDNNIKRFASLAGTLGYGAYILLLFVVVQQLWGMEALGNFAWTFQLQQILTFAACFGLPGLMLAEQSCGETSSKLLWRWGHQRLLVRLGIVTFGYFILVAILSRFDSDSVTRSQILACLFPHMIFISLTRFHLAVMSGRGEIIYFGLLTTLRLMLAVSSLMLGYMSGFGLIGSVFISLSSSEIIVLCFTFWLARPREDQLEADLEIIKEREKHIGLSSILSEASGRLDILITGLILNTAEAGLFAFLSQFARTPLLIAQSQLRLLVPVLSRLRGSPDFSSANNVIKRNIYFSYGLVLLLVLLLSVIQQLIPQVDNSYEIVLFWGLFFGFSLQAIPGLHGSLFIAFGRPEIQMRRLLLLLVVLTISISVFTYLMGVGGAVVAVILSYFLHFSLIKHFFKRVFPAYDLHMPVSLYTVLTILICLLGLVICLI